MKSEEHNSIVTMQEVLAAATFMAPEEDIKEGTLADELNALAINDPSSLSVLPYHLSKGVFLDVRDTNTGKHYRFQVPESAMELPDVQRAIYWDKKVADDMARRKSLKLVGYVNNQVIRRKAI